MGCFNESLLKSLGVEVNVYGKMPDVIIYCPNREWLILVESVTNHGPVDGKRHGELQELFKESTVGIVRTSGYG